MEEFYKPLTDREVSDYKRSNMNLGNSRTLAAERFRQSK
jgi:hypothetical protein